jgi:hypothetical protein
MTKTMQFLLGGMLFLQISARAQTNAGTKKWGFETELIQPFFPNAGIIRLQATRILSTPESRFRGDLMFGGYIRPNVKHDIVEKINEYLLMTGYRQYLWKGLHLDAKSNIGYSWGTKNKIDGKDYNEFSWFWEGNLGYKLDFAKSETRNFYLIAQFGVISKIMANAGPRGGKSDTFPQGNLLFGINF